MLEEKNVNVVKENEVRGKFDQTVLVRNHLLVHGSITPMEALREYGIMRLAAVIHKLRFEVEPLMVIKTEIVYVKNRFGRKTHYAIYRLAEG